MTVAIHAVTQRYTDTEPMALKNGEGIANKTCIKLGAGHTVLYSTAHGDDNYHADHIDTGANGVCETDADPSDMQVFSKGQGIHKDIVPQNTPAAATLQDYLNQVFGIQTNTYFTVTRSDFASDHDINKNGIFDIRINFGIFTDEENLIATHRTGADFDIFYFSTYSPESSSVGVTKQGGFAYVRDGSTQILNTTAHEVGHLLGLMHATDAMLSYTQQNPAYLPGTDHKKRLMTTNEQPGIAPTLLIKPEWDIINKLK